MQYVLDWRRRLVGPNQHGRMVGVEGTGLAVLHLLTGTVEAVNRRLVVGTVDPLVGGAELELGDLRVAFDGIDGGE